MKNTIYVLEGSYRNKTIENQTFQLVKSYQPYPHKEGGFITVKIDDIESFPGATKNQIRINLESENKLRDKAPEEAKAETEAKAEADRERKATSSSLAIITGTTYKRAWCRFSY